MLGIFFTVSAYLVGGLVYYFYSLSTGFKRKETIILLAIAMFGGILGAKIVRLLFSYTSGVQASVLLTHPDGRTIIGGILIGWLFVEIAKKYLRINKSTGDAFALALSAGETLGRLGCFFNSCCYGIPAESIPWAVEQAGKLRHPTQLYSSISSLCIFILLCCLQKKVQFEGDLFRFYLLLYSTSRFCLEFLRERSEIFYGFSIAQWICLEIAISMVFALLWTYKCKINTINPESAK